MGSWCTGLTPIDKSKTYPMRKEDAMKSQTTTRKPIAGAIFFVTLVLIIWACDVAFGLPTNVVRAGLLATVFSSLAVTL